MAGVLGQQMGYSCSAGSGGSESPEECPTESVREARKWDALFSRRTPKEHRRSCGRLKLLLPVRGNLKARNMLSLTGRLAL